MDQNSQYYWKARKSTLLLDFLILGEILALPLFILYILCAPSLYLTPILQVTLFTVLTLKKKINKRMP